MKRTRQILSTIHFLTGFLVTLAAIWRFIHLGGWEAVHRSYALARRLMGGIASPEDLSAVASSLLPLLIAFILGVVLMLQGADMKKMQPILPKLGAAGKGFLIALIGIEVVEVTLFVRIEALIFAFLITLVLAFHVYYQKLRHLDGSVFVREKRPLSTRVYQISLEILGLLIITKTVLSCWVGSRFPGFLIEYL